MTAAKSLVDPKVYTAPVLYLPAGWGRTPPAGWLPRIKQWQRRGTATASQKIHQWRRPCCEIPVEGLLYWPNRYVVAGSSFNEMYGAGTAHSHSRPGKKTQGLDLAKGAWSRNFFFEIEIWGPSSTQNVPYFFTRSQKPPFP